MTITIDTAYLADAQSLIRAIASALMPANLSSGCATGPARPASTR
jgi:hypothetical protein